MDPLEKNKDAEIVTATETNENALTAETTDTTEVVETSPVPEKAEEPVVELETVEPEKAVDPVAETASIAESESIKFTSPPLEAKGEDVEIEELVIEAESIAPENAEEPATDLNQLGKSELIELLKGLLAQPVHEIRDEVEQIKQHFYRKVKAETDESRRKFVEEGGDELSFIPEKDDLDQEFKDLLITYKQGRAAVQAKTEAEKENNLLQKQHILERMEVLLESNDDVSTHINEFRDLQKKWKTVGPVPQSHVNELWRKYSGFQEAFWDLIKINNELREYDFKKNLEAKTLLCETAEKLDEEKDIVSAFHQLQKLHDEWREIGPVAREVREEIWNRFKEASSVINRKHQGHFDDIRKLEDGNLKAKTALCEKLEAFDYSELNSYKGWDDATKTIIQWQEEWRSIGFAPRKHNHKIFDRYRAACDAFFAAKSTFYKESKSSLNDNLDKKKELCEKAEALMNNTDWKETSDLMVQMQKDWKAIGPVPKKHSDDIWKRFIAACDHFFEEKQKNSSDQRSVELQNLTKKKELIEQIKALNPIEGKNPAEVLSTLRELIAAWNEVGFVPFRDKDKVYKEYRTAVDQMFELLNVDSNQRRLDNFRSNLRDISGKGENKLYREREKLMRAFEHLKSEIATYENNFGFLTATNKKGSGLINEMERKIEALKEEARLIEQKVNLIDENI